MSIFRKISIAVSVIIFLFVFAYLIRTTPDDRPAFQLFNETQDKKEEQSAVIKWVVIGGKEIKVNLADTPSERVQGLSGTLLLPLNEGMFFVFDEPGYNGFWMKDMNFALDIIWLEEDLRIVHIEEGVLPESYPEVFKPEKKSKYVLEVNTGFVERYKILVGDEIEIK